MAIKINNNTITLTRGDTLRVVVGITMDGEEYTPASGDVMRFAMKKKVADEETLIEKVIPNDTMTLELEPEDTKSLDFGTYYYDIEVTMEDGTVNTFITKSAFIIAEEIL